jgi:outer membrane protein, heavy metal efflux system
MKVLTHYHNTLLLLLLLLSASVALAAGRQSGNAEPRPRASVDSYHGFRHGARLPVLSRDASLEKTLRYADLSNGDLLAAWHEWRAALERVPQVRSLDNPQLSIGYMFAADPFARRETPLDMKKWTVDRGIIGFSQMIPWPGKRQTRADKALCEAVASAERFRRMRFDVRNQVLAAYVEFVYNQWLTDLDAENVRILKQIYEAASHQFHAGELRETDVAKLDIEILRGESELRAAQIDRDRRLAELNSILNRDPRTTFTALGLDGVNLETSSTGRLLRIAACNNPELEEIRRRISARGADVVLAELERYPDFEINLPQVQTLTQMAMIGFTLPIRCDRINAGIREMTAMRDAELARLRNQEHGVPARMVVALTMLRDAQRVLDDYEGRITVKTNEVLTLQQQYYGAGAGDILSVLDTERTLIDIGRLVIRARADRVRAMGEIESVAGCELIRFDSPAPKPDRRAETHDSGTSVTPASHATTDPVAGNMKPPEP